MELMTLLFCALVANLPQALAFMNLDLLKVIDTKGTEVKFNNSRTVNQNVQRKKVLLNINGPPLVNVVTDLQLVFKDEKCKQCIYCMERTIKAYKTNELKADHHFDSDNINEKLLYDNQIPRLRLKRQVKSKESPSIKSKSKRRSKMSQNKTFAVTKYNVDGKIYALKVKEFSSQEMETLNEVKSCQVYSIKKSFDCFDSEADSLLRAAKKKKNKIEKIVKGEKGNLPLKVTTDQSHFVQSSFKKRQADNSHVPENFMPSIEENMY